jgi:uncharacterized membrane protein
MLHRFRNNFFTGLAIILPLSITIVIVRYLLMTINNFLLNPLINFLRVNPYLTERYNLYIAKTLIFVTVIFTIALIGWAANILFLRKFFGFGERMFLRIPMAGKIYSTIKEISSAFIGQGKTIFKAVVVIEYPRKGLYSMGFSTMHGEIDAGPDIRRNLLTVFIPTTPNPTSGIFLLVPKEDVTFLDMSVEDGLKTIVSSGAVIPPLKVRVK